MTIWEYKSMLFEFSKNGLLSGRYVDDEEMERELNHLGRQGWELVNVSLVQDGLLTFLKRPAAEAEPAGGAPAAPKAGENASPAERRTPPLPREGRAPISVEYLRARRGETENAPPRTRRHERDETPDDDPIGGIRIS